MKVRFNNVNFSYDEESVVLKNFNLTINNGEMVAILGHNGSGKSTIAKIMMGLLEVSSGEIYINDTLVSEETIDQLRLKMGIIFQNPDNQFVGVTVKDDIAFGLENRCMSREQMLQQIDKYIKLLNMEPYLETNPENLSGGQKQRVALAGALAMENELIIFDESTSMLDPLGTKEVIQTIKELKEKQNKTIIVITHNLEEAVFADRVMVINEGKVIISDTPQEVFKNTPLLEACGLVTLEGIEILEEIKKTDLKNKEAICEALWELTFKM